MWVCKWSEEKQFFLGGYSSFALFFICGHRFDIWKKKNFWQFYLIFFRCRLFWWVMYNFTWNFIMGTFNEKLTFVWMDFFFQIGVSIYYYCNVRFLFNLWEFWIIFFITFSIYIYNFPIFVYIYKICDISNIINSIDLGKIVLKWIWGKFYSIFIISSKCFV